MEFYSFQISLAIAVVVVTVLMHWLASLVENLDLNDDREPGRLTGLDPCATPLSSAVSSSAPMVGNPEEAHSASPGLVVDSPAQPSSTRGLKYDVFLSFRGPDTRRSITSELYYQLQKAGIQTFMDKKDLEVGDKFSPELLKAIQNSSHAIIILSPNYASSPWCLVELSEICDFMKDNRRILPLFYQVDPADVRHQRRSFKDAFRKHEISGRYKSKTMEQWRNALKKVASFTGWTTQDMENDRELIQCIVEKVHSKVAPTDEINRGYIQEFGARQEAMNNILKVLEDDKINVFGVHGMGGIGKSTMVKHVAAVAKIKGTFNHVIMVEISQTPKFENIQGMLADQLAIRLTDITEAARANKLSSVIRRKDKVLVILDDIWEAIDLSRIGVPKEHQKCKVLLTTRREDVCKSMDCQREICLGVLSEEHSLNFFRKISGIDEQSPFFDVATNVARGCAGLPLSLEAVAKALKGKEINEWNEAARRLKVSQPANLGDARVFSCVKFSYDCLRSEDAKSCFLLCCLFPEEYDIQIEDLVTYGFGKGLFLNCQICNTLKDARDIVHSEVKYLKSSSLLLDGKHDGHVRMHAVIRQMAISIAFSEDGQRAFVKAACNLQQWPKINPQVRYSAISLMVNKFPKLPEKLAFPELQILLLQHNSAINDIPNSFFESLNELRVLDLSKTSISSLPLPLPPKFLLNNLHTLYLDSCERSFDISILGQLEKLEILSLRECCYGEVPEAIGCLTNLRMLDITESKIVKFASNVISRLRELEELYLQCSFRDWGSKVEELAGLPYLTTLKIGISDVESLPRNVEVNPNWDHFDMSISKDFEARKSTWKPRFSHGDSRTLTLSTTIDTLPDWFINVVAEKAEKLQYRNCENLKNIMVEYGKGRLRGLKYLLVYGCHEKMEVLMNTEVMNQDEPVFEKLEELHLRKVDIKKLYVGKLPLRSLCNLMLLSVRSCHNLVKTLLHRTLLERLQHLETLFCADMNGLEYVFGSGEVVYKKLQQIRLCYLPKLIKIWNGHVPTAIFHNLKSLAVSGCMKLKSLFTSEVAQCFLQLEDLWVYSCFSLESVVEVSEETKNFNVEFPKLKNLVLADLPRLTRLYSDSSRNGGSMDIKFPSLKYFYMWRCHKFPPLASVSYIKTKDDREPADIQHYILLKERLWGDMEITSTISEDSKKDVRYDVYLSFRGNDTRKGITSHLYNMLHKRGIKTFMDDSVLVVGDFVSPTPLKIIEESRFAIVVLSPNYASSTWCLEELTHICECMKDNKRILPLFYNVEPSDVRFCMGSFGKAFAKHESSNRHSLDKMQRWRDALNKVVGFSGWKTEDFRTDRELVDKIVDFVCGKVQHTDIESTRDFEAYEATRKAMDQVMNALEDDEVTAVGVYGMGGVGKTTMAKHVGVEARKKGIFNHVIMVPVSQIPDLKNIQQTLLAKLLGHEDFPEIGRDFRLYEEIVRKKNILIILDDIWGFIDLSRIGIPSHDWLRRCNSKVLLTTRRWEVCCSMTHAVIHLNMLSEQDSWSLFVKEAKMSFESANFEYEYVAKRIAKECMGLPIVLIGVARALRDQDTVEWERALESLRRRIAYPDDVFKCIKLSYDYLKDEDNKSCFLLCCLYPEDYDIPIEDLFRYAVGKGLFRDADSLEEARDIANSVITHLKNCSLLLDGKKNGCVRMHDVVRDTAMEIAKLEDGYGFLVAANVGLNNWPRGSLQRYSAISLMKNAICKLPEEWICPDLQILLLQGNFHLSEIPENFIQVLNELRVLDLSNTSISSLPVSFYLLANLRGLYLDSCKVIIDTSQISRLYKLEILSMRYTCLGELPREIGDLTNLRMLDVTGGLVNVVPPNVISRLHRLEELHMQCEFFDWGTKFDELSNSPSLKMLKVCISDAKCLPQTVEMVPNWVYFGICISKTRKQKEYTWDGPDSSHVHSRALTLDTAINTLPDWFTNLVTKRAEKLRYVNRKGLNILDEFGWGRLHDLKYLSLIDCDLEQLMNPKAGDTNEPVFKNLEILHLSAVDYLKELCVGELPLGSLYNLKLLEVEACRNLVDALLPSNLLQSLHNLEKISCSQMDGMKYVFGCEGPEPGKAILTKLREMKLIMLDNLASFWNGPSVLPHSLIFQSLKVLVVVKCRKLRYLFTSDTARSLLQLEDLWVQDCHSLESVIKATEDTKNDNNGTNGFPVLKNLVLEDLPNLTGSYTSTTGRDVSLGINCPLLQHMYVNNCPHFQTSASDFHSRNDIQFNDDQHYRSLLKRFIAGP